VENAEQAVCAAQEIGFPVMLRAAFALGGKGSGVARNEDECFNLASRAFVGVPPGTGATGDPTASHALSRNHPVA